MVSRSASFALILAALSTLSFIPDVVTDKYTGYAYQEGTSNLIYIEEFSDKLVDGNLVETKTNYFDPEGNKIAERVLDFRQSKFAPNFKTEDLRTGYLEGAETVGHRIRLFVRREKQTALEEKWIEIPEPRVVDGGFNQFIKSHWDELENGEMVSFNFCVSSRLDYYAFRASKAGSTKTELIVKVEPGKAILRWLAAPIMITYNKETKRIVSYEGKSNIADENGTNFTTRLVYPKKGP